MSCTLEVDTGVVSERVVWRTVLDVSDEFTANVVNVAAFVKGVSIVVIAVVVEITVVVSAIDDPAFVKGAAVVVTTVGSRIVIVERSDPVLAIWPLVTVDTD